MANTLNYNLSKPDKGATNWHLNVNNNMDIIDTELKNISDSIVNALNSDDIINNLEQEEVGKVLDATQGKILDDKIGILSQGLESTSGSVTALQNQVDSHMMDFVSVLAYGTDKNSATIQAALNAVEALGGRTVIIPGGTYLINEIIYVPSNIRLIGDGEVILKRNANINAVMITKSDGITGGYDACKNITIENITFDGSQSDFQPDCTLFASGHASNITIRGCTFKNLDGWHMIELNATKDSLVENCTFYNYGYGDTSHEVSEMLQLDFANSEASGVFPWYGPYDNKPCKNIKIQNNVFKKSRWKAIGNHSFMSNVVHKDIYIINNLFEEIKEICIAIDDVDGLNIINNKFNTVSYAIRIVNQQNAVKNVLIDSNYYIGNRAEPYVSGEGRFLGVNPTGRNGFVTTNVKISNNTIINANNHGIGLTASDVIIEGNKIEGCYSNGMYFYGGDNAVISNNIIKNNNVGASAGRADFIIGNNATDVSSNVTVLGNRVGNLIVGSYISNVFVHSNNVEQLWPSEGIVKNNLIAGVFTA